jgi:RNA polymerase-binding transcription factor
MEDLMDYEHGTVIDSLRQRLLDRRRAIVGRVARTDGLLGELDESTPSEVEEEAQELNQARIVAQLGQRGRAELDAIDVAIELMERGDYGFCEECEEPIDVARLEVLPTARRCTTCAEASERRARQMAKVTSIDDTVDDEL